MSPRNREQDRRWHELRKWLRAELARLNAMPDRPFICIAQIHETQAAMSRITNRNRVRKANTGQKRGAR